MGIHQFSEMILPMDLDPWNEARELWQAHMSSRFASDPWCIYGRNVDWLRIWFLTLWLLYFALSVVCSHPLPHCQTDTGTDSEPKLERRDWSTWERWSPALTWECWSPPPPSWRRAPAPASWHWWPTQSFAALPSELTPRSTAAGGQTSS